MSASASRFRKILSSIALSFMVAAVPALNGCGRGNVSGSGVVITPTPTSPPPNVAFCPTPPNTTALTAAQVTTIVTQAVTRAKAMNRPATILVTDREANVLAIFRMNGANLNTVISGGPLGGRNIPSELAALSKAGTCSFFGTTGNAFTPRTASFIVQEHVPPGVSFTPGGPLFGVQFSSLLFSDVNPKLPLGLSADSGAVPLYVNGFPVGGIGVELDGQYTFDPIPNDSDQSDEEIIAVAGSRGFEAPTDIRGDRITVDGVDLKFLNAPAPVAETPVPNLAAEGSFLTIAALGATGAPRAGTPYLGAGSQFSCGTLNGKPVRIFAPYTNINGNAQLTAAEVTTILSQAINQANVTRAAIRRPLNSFAEVNVCVVAADGTILGIRGTPDAPIFGLDVCVQKGRSAAFMSSATCAATLNAQGLGSYVTRAAADGLPLNGSIAFSSRGFGSLHRPFFPDGIDCTGSGPCAPNAPGPFSRQHVTFNATNPWSPFNVGLQVDAIAGTLADILSNYSNPGSVPTPRMPPAAYRNGLQIFAGGVPIYKNGVLVGAVGISGDGIDQDDIICSFGSAGFEAPVAMRTDMVFVRGVRLPYVKFPAQPNLP